MRLVAGKSLGSLDVQCECGVIGRTGRTSGRGSGRGSGRRSRTTVNFINCESN